LETPALASDIAISVRDLTKNYRLYSSHKERLKEALHPFRKRYHEEFWALQGVSFDVFRGQNVGVIGRNGAGKSTLLQLIAGVLTPSSGKISVAGRVSALLELGAGFSPDLTGRENVILSSTIFGVPKEEIPDRVAGVEAFADVGEFFDQPMKIYSSGMYARVAFANAIHVNPDVLIVDEILGVGDAKFQEKCHSKIRSLRDQGVCILFVSHSTDVIQRNCELALLLDGGKMIRYGPADAVVAAYHDLLYGAGQTGSRREMEQPKEGQEAPLETRNVTQESELKEFLEGGDKAFYQRFAYYNPYERRFGNGDAKIVDFLVAADGNLHFNVLTGHEQLTVYLKVNFHRTVESPRIGWAIASLEALVIAGSNTVMKNITFPPAHSGETWVYGVTIEPKLCGGQYFLNVGIGDHDGENWIVLDEARSVAHFAVADLGKASGYFEAPSKFEVVRGPRNI
jgi:lipopolysaccharide transport system ATP-binding protein